MKSLNEIQLIETIINGDTDQFSELVSPYSSALFRTILGIVGNHHAAEDVFQDVMIKTFQNLNKFQQKSTFKVWLYRIAINTCNSLLRRKELKQLFSLEWLFETDSSLFVESRHDFQVAVENKEELIYLMKCLSGLKRSDRHLLVLWAYEGLSYDEISQICDVPVGTVKSRLSRAKTVFRLSFLGGEGNDKHVL